MEKFEKFFSNTVSYDCVAGRREDSRWVFKVVDGYPSTTTFMKMSRQEIVTSAASDQMQPYTLRNNIFAASADILFSFSDAETSEKIQILRKLYNFLRNKISRGVEASFVVVEFSYDDLSDDKLIHRHLSVDRLVITLEEAELLLQELKIDINSLTLQLFEELKNEVATSVATLSLQDIRNEYPVVSIEKTLNQIKSLSLI